MGRARPEREAGRARRCPPWRRLGRAGAVAQRVMRECSWAITSSAVCASRACSRVCSLHRGEATPHNSHPVQGQEVVL
jgi:hypothetical protein